MRHRRLVFALAGLASAVVLPAAATGAAVRIVPQKGIGGITLGMTREQVKARLGVPAKVRHGFGTFGPWTTLIYDGLVVGFTGNTTANSISTRSPAERTAQGVGVGSTIQAVAANVAGSRCLKEFGYLHCYVGRWAPGRVITDFAITAGRVTRVSVGIVID